MSNSTQWTDLTAFQRDLLEVILDTASRDDPRSGQEIKVDLEAHREETVNHGRLYPNLDTLEAHGLIEVEKIDDRTNGNRPTEAAIELIRQRDGRTHEVAAQYDREPQTVVADGGKTATVTGTRIRTEGTADDRLVYCNGEPTDPHDAGGADDDGYVQASTEIGGETAIITVSFGLNGLRGVGIHLKDRDLSYELSAELDDNGEPTAWSTDDRARLDARVELLAESEVDQ